MADTSTRESWYPLRPPAVQTPESGEAWRHSRGSARTLRYVSLLYTAFFFIEPYYQHSVHHWIWFGIFYVSFVSLYFIIPRISGTLQKVLIGAMFMLAFAYFPFNSSACGAFVYPVVILAFVMPRTVPYIVVVLSTSAALMLETWYFHLPLWTGFMGVFFCIVVGFSNLAYSRQQQASYLLRRANQEIEHLAQVAERERIARDLHDLLGHTLTVIAIKSELAHRLLDRDSEAARREMQEVETTARKALEEVREAVTGYRAEGIAGEIALASRALKAAGVSLTTEVECEDISASIGSVLTLCVREAVTNIVRHAAATGCSIRVYKTGKDLCLSVIDNGCGFNGSSGNGLRGMKERVCALNGSISVRNLSTGGTEVFIAIPFAASCSAPSLPGMAVQV